MPYTIGKLKRIAFQQAKDHSIGATVREIRPWKVPGLKIENFQEYLGATPNPRGFPAEGYRSICMEGVVTHSQLGRCESHFGVRERTANHNELLSWVGFLERARICELG